MPAVDFLGWRLVTSSSSGACCFSLGHGCGERFVACPPWLTPPVHPDPGIGDGAEWEAGTSCRLGVVMLVMAEAVSGEFVPSGRSGAPQRFGRMMTLFEA